MAGAADSPRSVGFLGAGQMATALAGGWAKAGLLDVARSRASDPVPAARHLRFRFAPVRLIHPRRFCRKCFPSGLRDDSLRRFAAEGASDNL